MSINITPAAVSKIKQIRGDKGSALRFGVQGGGCSGFSYNMQWENEAGPMDKMFKYPVPPSLAGYPGLPSDKVEDLVVIVDATSLMYLDGVTVDYVETLEASGFKFDNPNVKTTCGCGSSFAV